MSLILQFNYYTKPEYINEIGTQLLEKYFPSGEINDDSHINAVKVIFCSHISKEREKN